MSHFKQQPKVLVKGNGQKQEAERQRYNAARNLYGIFASVCMDERQVTRLLADLKETDPARRDRASANFWHSWFHQKGVHGAQQLMQAESFLQSNQVEQADQLLSEIIQAQPDFAEAWNRRAVLRYTSGDYWRAIADCQKAVELVPYHFGALHGLGLCHSAVGNYTAAIEAFRRALAVQPYALSNQRMILECTAKLA